MSHLLVFSHHSPLWRWCMIFFLLRFISYPRTETNIFPPNLVLGPLVEQQTQSPAWGAFAQRVLDQPGGPNPRQGKKTDQAHPPIHPTKYINTLQVCHQNLMLSVAAMPICPAINWILRLTITLFIFTSRTLYAQLITLIIPGIVFFFFLNVDF